MKRKYIYLLVLALVACQDSGYGLHPADGRVVEFALNLGGEEDATDWNAAKSRLHDGDNGYDRWDIGDEVGIYMVDSDDPQSFGRYPKYENVPYRLTNSATSGQVEPVNYPILYPSDGSEVSFVSYYPRTSISLDLQTGHHLVPIDVSTQDPLGAIDFVYGRSAKADKYSGIVLLEHEHQLSRITIYIERDPDRAPFNLGNEFITLMDFPAKTNFDLNTGMLTDDIELALVLPVFNEAASTDDRLCYEAIIVPHQGEEFGQRTIAYEVVRGISPPDNAYILPPSVDFEPGKHYTYTFTLGAALTLKSTSTRKWSGPTMHVGGYQLRIIPEAIIAGIADSPSITVGTTSPNTLSLGNFKISTNPTTVVAPAPADLFIDAIDVVKDQEQNFLPWQYYTVTLDCKLNTDPDARVCYLHITMEGTTWVMKVTQEGIGMSGGDLLDLNNSAPDRLSNCYIVPPGKTMILPIDRAYSDHIFDYENSGFNLLTRAVIVDRPGGSIRNEKFYPVVLWDDRVASPDGVSQIDLSPVIGNRVSVTVGPGEGNALVAMRRDSPTGPIAWSWHLWITDYNPAGSPFVIEPDRFVYMERNLGATLTGAYDPASYGLLYQWGRKDPFPGGVPGAAGYAALNKFYGLPGSADPVCADFLSVSSGGIRLEALLSAHKNPTRFFRYFDDTNPNWAYEHGLEWEEKSNRLWAHGVQLLYNNRPVDKSFYDPCPAGWRVPSFQVESDEIIDPDAPGIADNSPWIGLDDNLFGTYFPQAGMRNSVGEYQAGNMNLWSASPTFNNQAINLQIEDGSPSQIIRYAHPIPRANAASVRCIKDFGGGMRILQ